MANNEDTKWNANLTKYRLTVKHNSSMGCRQRSCIIRGTHTRVSGAGRHRDSLQRINGPTGEFDNRASTKDEGPKQKTAQFCS
jgi:hypothetical protein